MPTNLVYKGDLAEVSLAKETGLFGQGTNVTSGTGSTAGWNTADGTTDNSSTITVGAGLYWVTAAQMEVPDGMLVGATLRIYSSGGSNRYTGDDYPSSKRTYYITANAGNTITIQPRLATTGAVIGHTGDYFIINGLRVPTIDTAMTASDQRIKADQFLGLLNSFSLPEPEIDVKKQHIVGMGRDVNVMTSGKETLAGGAFDTMGHSLRMFKYALGGHTARSKGEFSNVTAADTVLGAKPLNFKDAGSQQLAAQIFGTGTVDDSITAISGTTITGLGSSVNSDVLIGAKTDADSATDITIDSGGLNFNAVFESMPAAGFFRTLSAAGDVLLGTYTGGGAGSKVISGCADFDAGALARAQTADVPLQILAQPATAITAGDLRVQLTATLAALFTVGDYIQIYDKDTVQIPGADAVAPTLYKHEIRRVIAIGTAGGGDAAYLYVEEPFLFGHTAASMGIDRLQYTYDTTNVTNSWKRGSPAIVDTTNELKYGVVHNFFGYSYLPTFSVEQSFRQTDVTPGAEQMLRVFGGCKVNGLTCIADSEGELKISGDYEAGRMFTDTGGVFITPHRMFENTANTKVNRRVSGIAVNGEKPYLFQHISFSAFGAVILRAKNAELTIANTNTAQWYVRGVDGAFAAADQVQESATQYASEITEAAREYTFKFSALVEDSRWFDELRKRTHHLNTNDITLTVVKPGSHATRQNGVITIEDYTVSKAEHPLPDDKGPVTANVEFQVRHMKVTETNPYFVL